MYAPPLAVALVPFTILSQASATILWFLLRVVLLAIGCWAMPIRAPIRLMVFAAAAFSQPVLVDLLLGNVSVIVLVLLAFAWRWLDRPLGSISIALAMSVRPTLGILLVWWALRRRWAQILWTLVAGTVLIALTIPFLGARRYEEWLQVLRNIAQTTGVENNIDLASTALRLNLVPEVATGALVAGYAVAIGASVWSLRYDRDLSFIVTVGASILLAPLLWNHYLAGLVLPAAFLANRGRPIGLVLPLLGWLPDPLLPLVAIAGTVAPFLAMRPVVAVDEAVQPVQEGALVSAPVTTAQALAPLPASNQTSSPT
jgi:hypothetical protein